MKCTWQTCKGCPQCGKPPFLLAPIRWLGHSKSRLLFLQSHVSMQVLRMCRCHHHTPHLAIANAVAPATTDSGAATPTRELKCKQWCGPSPQSWAAKCAFAACTGCSPCLPAAGHSIVSCMGSVGVLAGEPWSRHTWLLALNLPHIDRRRF